MFDSALTALMFLLAVEQMEASVCSISEAWNIAQSSTSLPLRTIKVFEASMARDLMVNTA